VTKTTYSPEERAARLEAAKAELTTAVEAVATSEQWQAFLAFAGKLHSYSANNRFWLFQQAMTRGWDDLGYVAGFRTWLSLGRYVRKGERGLKVLAPCRYKVTDKETGEESWALRGFTVETVFVARQTDGEGEIPELIRPALLAGAGPDGAWDALAEVVNHKGFKIERASLFPANGQTSFAAKVVTVADRLDEAAAVKTLAHELAHVMLHQPGQVDYHANRPRCEAEAESTAYLVCSQLGLASDGYSFPYVATWAAGDMHVVTAAADKALKCASEILDVLGGQGTAVAA
jgi:antirestriction protein ArdC